MAFARRLAGAGVPDLEGFSLKDPTYFKGFNPRYLLEALGDVHLKAREKLFTKNVIYVGRAWDPIMRVTDKEFILLNRENVHLKIIEGLFLSCDRHLFIYAPDSAANTYRKICQNLKFISVPYCYVAFLDLNVVVTLIAWCRLPI